MHSFTRAMAVVAAVIVLGSCTPEPEPDPRIAVLAAKEKECTQALSESRYLDAIDIAGTALSTPKLVVVGNMSVDRLRFCYTTSSTLHYFVGFNEEVTQLVGLFGAILDGFKKGPPFEPHLMEVLSSPVSMGLELVLDPLQSLLENNRKHMDEVIKNPNFVYDIPHLSIIIADEEFLNAGGKFDLGEVQFLRALNEALLSVVYFIRIADFTVNLSSMIDYAVYVTDSPLKRFSDQPVSAILNVAAVLFATSPSFLTLNKNHAEYIEALRDAMTSFSDAGHQSLSVMQARQSQDGHPLMYRKNADDREFVVVNMSFNEDFYTRYDLSKFDGLAIPLFGDAAASYKTISESFAARGGVRVGFQRDVLPFIATIVVTLVNSGWAEHVLKTSIASLSRRQAELAQSLLEFISSNHEYMLTALLTAFPAPIELDFGGAFADPIGARDYLPAWTEPEAPQSMSDYTTSTIVYSFECATDENPLDHIPERHTCDDMLDAGHFQDLAAPYNNPSTNNFGPRWEGPITRDGLSVRTPYIGFKDATFNNFLYIDVTPISGVYLDAPQSGDVPPATQKNLNAAFAATLGSIEKLMSQ